MLACKISKSKFFQWYQNTIIPELVTCVIMWNVAFFSVSVTNSFFILGQALASIPVFCFLLAKIMLFATSPKRKLMAVGATWGVLCLGMQTAWFVLLHLKFPKYYPIALVGVWVAAVIMFAALGAGFSTIAFFVCRNTKRLINKTRTKDLGTLSTLFLFSCLTLALWNPFCWYLTRASFWPTSQLLGYPFFSPMIPLESARRSNFGAADKTSDVSFKWIEPTSYKNSLRFDQTIEFDPYTAGKQVAKELVARQEEGDFGSKNKKIVLMAPESTFPFFINNFPEVIELWASCLQPNALFLVGTYREENKKKYQCTAVISNRGLEQLLDKKFLTPFAEARFTPGANLSLPNLVDLTKKQRLQSIICFEFFSNPSIIQSMDKDLIPVVFGNDSWYPRYFKVLLHNFAKLKARESKRPLIYLSHEKNLCLGPIS